MKKTQAERKRRGETGGGGRKKGGGWFTGGAYLGRKQFLERTCGRPVPKRDEGKKKKFFGLKDISEGEGGKGTGLAGGGNERNHLLGGKNHRRRGLKH